MVPSYARHAFVRGRQSECLFGRATSIPSRAGFYIRLVSLKYPGDLEVLTLSHCCSFTCQEGKSGFRDVGNYKSLFDGGNRAEAGQFFLSAVTTSSEEREGASLLISATRSRRQPVIRSIAEGCHALQPDAKVLFVVIWATICHKGMVKRITLRLVLRNAHALRSVWREQ